MTLAELKEGLTTLGTPVAYHHFNQKTALPYLVYASGEEPDFMADNRVYQEFRTGYIELYTDKKDPALERRVKHTLAAMQTAGFAFAKEYEAYIDSENVYVNRWRFTFIGSDENGG